jgi:peptidoglycan/LPS O-acetylase OafA/YrhL
MNEEIKAASDVARDPASVSIATYAWIFGVGILGGAVRVFREINLGGKTKMQIVGTFVVELVTSVFVGIVTFYLCNSGAKPLDPFYTATLVSIAAYMGGRALTVLEAIFKAFAPKGGNDGSDR